MEIQTSDLIGLDLYQKGAMSTCMPTCDNLAYMLPGLMSEVGEVAGKYAKAVRKGLITISHNRISMPESPDNAVVVQRIQLGEDIKDELGDVLWFVSGMCHIFGWDLSDIAARNLRKLASRQERGVIDGNGDHR